MSSNKLIPDLRFPEFENEGEWEEKLVSQLAEYENGKAHEQDINEEGKYVVVNSKFISTDGEVRKFTNSANCIARADDILMVLSDVPNGRAIAKCFYVDRDNFYTVNQRICKLTPTNADSKILYYLLNRNSHFLSFDDGVKQTNLRNEDVLNCPIILPKSPQEQQKIASCLSSLDELISAHNIKLELLKDHKKGLMQNLFPHPSASSGSGTVAEPAEAKVPKLRFKEFEKDGEWVEKKLGEVFSTYSGGTPSTTEKEFYGGKIPFIRSAEISKDKTELFLTEAGLNNSSAKMVKKGDLLIALYGANSGDVAISKIDGAINQAILCLKSEFSNEFTCHYLFHKKDWIIARYLQGGQGNLSGDIVKSIELSFPSKAEQQKIAACLSSLDSLITAQAEKIEQLKWHKKGLMQGLFPRIND